MSFKIILHAAHTVWVCVLYEYQEKTVIIPLFSINWLVFKTVIKCVYWAVQTGSLNKVDYCLYKFVGFYLGSFRDYVCGSSPWR